MPRPLSLSARQIRVRRQMFARGFRDAWPVALTFLAMYTAIGAAGHAAGLSTAQGVFMTVAVFAAPAQIAAIDMIASGATVTVIATVAIINARFFLMAASLTPRLGMVRFTPLVGGLSMLTASTFAVTYSRINSGPVFFPFAYYLGVCICSLSAAALGTVIGHTGVSEMPPAIELLLAMLLPVYFVTFLARAWPRFRFVIAGGCGALLTPAIEAAAPGFGLIGAAGLIGSTFVLADRPSGGADAGSGKQAS